MERATQTGVVAQRRLARACKHVTDLWFPASPDLLKQIQGKLEAGAYRGEVAPFYQDVRSDFSLFMYMVRKLVRLTQEAGRPTAASPAELFAQASLDELKALLNFDDPVLVRHNVIEMSRAQSMRLEEALVSASAVETLATPHGLDPESGYATALLRQLGNTLIAFNYPSVYEEALHGLRGEESLDAKLAQVLGFTPTLLAVTLLQQWGISFEVFENRSSSSRNAQDSRNAQERAIGATLAKLCEVGEALARANNPETYPTASHDWDEAKLAIENALGRRGLATIRKTLKKNLSAMPAATPALFKAGLLLDPEAKIWSNWEGKHLDMNPFLAACSKEFRKPLHYFYEHVLQGQVPNDAVAMLVREILPLSGFQGGCVFTIDPSTRLFIPQLRISRVRLRLLEPVPYGNSDDPVAEAFETFETVIGRDVDTTSAPIIFMTGVIGYSQRIGVLYLEVDEERYLLARADFEAHFRALCKSISDALRLS